VTDGQTNKKKTQCVHLWCGMYIQDLQVYTGETLSDDDGSDNGVLCVGDVVEYCQLETFSVRCRHGDVIVMTTARFGRMRVGKCIDGGAYSDSIIKQDGKTLGCYADVLDYADRTCSGRTSCDIFVPNRDLLSTRPCVSQLTMYFEAAYSCVPGKIL